MRAPRVRSLQALELSISEVKIWEILTNGCYLRRACNGLVEGLRTAHAQPRHDPWDRMR